LPVSKLINSSHFRAHNQMRKKRKQFGLKLHGRARITNGRGDGLLPTIDGRSIYARRFRDLCAAFCSDLAEDDTTLSEGQRALIRRASTLCVELEHMEVRFAHNGAADPAELDVFQRAVNSLRRLCETLAIHRGRIPRDVTPPRLDEYLHRKNGADSIEAPG
jgi:hypothetical protein